MTRGPQRQDGQQVQLPFARTRPRGTQLVLSTAFGGKPKQCIEYDDRAEVDEDMRNPTAVWLWTGGQCLNGCGMRIVLWFGTTCNVTTIMVL
jgi:hypothetical protein